MENFRFFALRYLNHWCDLDKRFVKGISNGSVPVLREAVQRYGIARNFKRCQDEDAATRLRYALGELGKVGRTTITEKNVDKQVCGLAKRLEQLYGKGKISAASKLLWFLHQDPVVMYDRNARRWLKVAPSDYRKYRSEWKHEFDRQKDKIRSACKELSRVKAFSLAYDMPEVEFKSLIRAKWFHERVFDMFLWWNGNKQRPIEVQTLQ